MQQLRRRSLLAVVGTVGTVTLAGCMDGGGSPADGDDSTPNETVTGTDTVTSTQTATSTEQAIECSGEYTTPTGEALNTHRTGMDYLTNAFSDLGDPRKLETSQPATSRSIRWLKRADDDEGNEDGYFRALEQQRTAREQAQYAARAFEILGRAVESCDIEQADVFAEAAQTGQEEAGLYAEAANHLIETTKDHLDRGSPAFEVGEDAQAAIDTYEEAIAVEKRDHETVENYVEEYRPED